MIDAVSPFKLPSKKRGQGRPFPGENDVGREHLLATTERLLRNLPPSRVTVARIAQEAGVNRALVRYYFGNRTALLLEVVDRVTAHAAVLERAEPPEVALAAHVAKTVKFVRSAPFMHRLMIDELMTEGTAETRGRVRDLNRDLVHFYRDLLAADQGRSFVDVNPILLHFAILGICDFFTAAEPVIRELLPDKAAVENLNAEFETFMTDLFMNGLRKH